MACIARDRAIADVQATPQVWPLDAIVAIILAGATTEAFINELSEMVALRRDSRPEQSVPVSPALCAFADAVQKIETKRERGMLQGKYLAASETLSGTLFDKGGPPHQDFSTLISGH